MIPTNVSVRLAVALSFLTMSGCAIQPSTMGSAYNDDMPANWQSLSTAGLVKEDWWLSFNDARLTSLVTEAAGENPRLLQAAARSDQARAQAGITGADRLPSISAMLNANRQGQPSAVNGQAQRVTSNSFGASLNVNWEVDLWGRIGSLSQAATQDFIASANNFRALRQSIAAQTAKAYFAVIEARQQLALSQRTVEAQQETARQIGNRADAGIVAPTDKLLSITNLETSRAGLLQRETVLLQTTRQLELLLRDYPAGTIETPEHLPAMPAQPAAGLPSELLARRPDLLAAERNLLATGLRRTAAKRSWLPTFSLTGSAGTQSSEFNNLLDGDFSLWSIAGQLVQPIFQGGRIRANIELARARQTEAAEAYADQALQAFSEVEIALASDEFLLQREAAFQRAADAASEAERIAFNRYNQGITPFLTVLESQQRALDTTSAFLSARRARLDNRVDLHLALGGGFSSSAAGANSDAAGTTTSDSASHRVVATPNNKNGIN